jgi:hypothetical protein
MKLSLLDKIVIAGSFWGITVLILAVILEPTPENYTLAVSITTSGFYTWMLYLSRPLWLERFSRKPIRGAFLVGSINAAVIETLFLIMEKTFGASGVAAHPNLLIDMSLTMPWYIGMTWIFVRVQRTERFSPSAVLLWGALYELGADGLVGGILLPGLMGEPIQLLTNALMMVVLVFWQFIPVYSSMVLPPAWILEGSKPAAATPRWFRGFLPLAWLIPFTIYLVAVLVIIGGK